MILRKLMLTVTGILFSLQVQALGLSRIEVYSKLNEPLSAKIEVVSVPKGESGNIRINLASGESFRRAGLERPQILSSLRFSVQPTGKTGATIRLSSPQPLREPFLNFLLEVTWPSGRILREYTVLLDPPLYEKKLQAISPPPAPMARNLAAETPTRATRATRATRTARAAATKPKKSSARKTRASRSNRGTTGRRSSSGGGGSYNVSANDTLWQIANSTRPQSVSLQRHMDNIYYANPGAFVRRNMNLIQAGRSIKIPGWDGQQVEPPPPSIAKTDTQGPIRTAENTESAPISEPPAPAPDKMSMAAETKVLIKPAPGPDKNNSAPTGDAQVADENKDLKQQLSNLQDLFKSTKDRLDQVDKELLKFKVQSQQFADLQKNFNKQAEDLKKANLAKQAAEQAAKAAKQELDKVKEEAKKELAAANKAAEQKLAEAKAAAKAVPPTTVAEVKPVPKPDTIVKPVAETAPIPTPPKPATEEKVTPAPPALPLAKVEEKPTTTTPEGTATPLVAIMDPTKPGPSLVPTEESQPPTLATESPTTKDTEKPSETTEDTKTATEAKTEEPTDTQGKEDNTTTGTDQQPPSPAGTQVPPLDKPVVPPVVAEAGLMDTVNGLVNQVPGGWLTLGGIGGGTVALLLIGGFLRRHRKADGGLAEWTEGTELTEGEVLAELSRLEAEAQSQETGPAGEGDDDINKLISGITGTNLAETPEPVDDELLENVDVYIAYETFDKAEELLKPAIAEHPTIHKYRVKLLEVYAAAKQEERFEEEAKDFYADTGGQSPLWGDVLNLWEGLGTGRELDVPEPITDRDGLKFDSDLMKELNLDQNDSPFKDTKKEVKPSKSLDDDDLSSLEFEEDTPKAKSPTKGDDDNDGPSGLGVGAAVGLGAAAVVGVGAAAVLLSDDGEAIEDTNLSLDDLGEELDLGSEEETETAVTTDESEDEGLGDLGLDQEEESLTSTEEDELNLEDGSGEEELDFGDSLEDTTAAETEEETDSSLDDLDMGEAVEDDDAALTSGDDGLSLDEDLSSGLEDIPETTEDELSTDELPTTEDDDLSSLDMVDNNDAATDDDNSLSLDDDDLSPAMDLGDNDSEVSAPADEELLDFGEEEIAPTTDDKEADDDLSLDDLDSESDSLSDTDNEDELSLGDDDLLGDGADVVTPAAEEEIEEDLSLDDGLAEDSSEVGESLSIPDDDSALEDDLSIDMDEEATPSASSVDEDEGNLDLSETEDLSFDEEGTDNLSPASEDTEELSFDDDLPGGLEEDSETAMDDELSLNDDSTMDEDTDTTDSSTTSKDSKDSDDELSLDDDELSLGDLDEEEAAATEGEDELSFESEPDSSLDEMETDDLSTMESEDDGLSMETESETEELSMEMDDNLSLDDNTDLMTDDLDSHATDNDDSAITDDELSLSDMDNMDMDNMDMDNNSDDTVMPSTDDDLGDDLGLDEGGAADDDMMDMSSLGLDDDLVGELGKMDMDDDLSSGLGELPDDADMMSSGDGDDIEDKFNLAQMYIDIGDADSARTTLEEIIAEGDDEQRRKAAKMMKNLA